MFTLHGDSKNDTVLALVVAFLEFRIMGPVQMDSSPSWIKLF